MHISRKLPLFFVLSVSACASTQSPEPKTTHAPPSSLPIENQELVTLIDTIAKDGPGGDQHQRALQAAQALHQNSSDPTQAHWRVARAIFYLVQAQPTRLDESLSKKCLKHGAQAAALKPSVTAYLYNALCMGVRAKFAPTEGLGLVKEMLAEAEKVHAENPRFDHAAGARLMGGIYLKAPSWPTSIGDGEMAIEYLEKAVSIAPDWPENKLLLAEAYYEEDRNEEALRALKELEALIQGVESLAWKQYFEAQLRTLSEEISP